MKHPIFLIAAVDEKFGIGIGQDLPWQLKKDMEFFQTTTTKTQDPKKQNIVIMGRKTWESIPENHRPLKNRQNIILTRNQNYQTNSAKVCTTLEEALSQADKSIESIFIIGGGNIYKQAINHPHIKGIYLTHIKKSYNCDTFFPSLPEHFTEQKLIQQEEENGVKFEFILHTTNNQNR